MIILIIILLSAFVVVVVIALIVIIVNFFKDDFHSNVNLTLSNEAYDELIKMQNEYNSRNLSDFVNRVIILIAKKRQQTKAGKTVVLTYQNGTDKIDVV